MAVYKIDSIQSLDENNIQNYIWLNSDLVGRIENPGAYFQNVNNNTLFQFEAGQYITIKKDINGEEVRRAYSFR